MRIGLCLSGGGAKGAFQAGVIKGLYDNGISKFDAISGTSIGAVNGYYVSTVLFIIFISILGFISIFVHISSNFLVLPVNT